VRTFFRLMFAMAVLAAMNGESARAQDYAAYAVTYVEVMPDALSSASALLKHYRDASRKEDENLRFDVLGEVARTNRFVIVEAWKDKAAFDAHAQSSSTKQFQKKLKAIQDAPPDQRITHALYLGRTAETARNGAIYVVTHIDVIPPGTDACMAALKTMSLDSAHDPGNVGYQVLEQANHANHFTVLEEWSDKKSADAHAMADHTRAFRATLMPIAGALYDERFYTALN
jgi:quinol monooxygenase YgiN